MARNTYGLDLGSYEIKVYDKKKDTIWKEKNVIAIRDKKEIFAVGDEAYEMNEKAPENIEVIFPMKEGVISRFNDMQFLLQNLLKKGRQFVRGSEYVIAVPTDVTEVEKKAFFDLVIHSTAKAREVNIVERSIADAVGLDLDVKNTKGIFIANFGGETTELSVLAGGGMVLNRLVKIGGVTFDQSLVNLIRHSHDFLIGRATAEVLRRRFGVFTGESEASLTVAGRDLITGVPMQKAISLSMVRASLRDPLLECVRSILSLLDRTPPEVRTAIYDNGIYLTGGIANMPGLDTYIEKGTGISTKVAQEPDICAVTGLKKIIMSKELRQLAYSMLDENYRWMR
ncbi:MAG TPA: rod shape-determining protein [Candidatus Dorea gallistercoris]|uniref:Cell shape-determining protein MreB n=1 Tax=Candidatus Dorea gallistercoris TaxID=2838542 RepID=A0A9D1RCU9_9FIRM|nr:rod shape-determining protein [Candidatus Dorea gallistercoris]